MDTPYVSLPRLCMFNLHLYANTTAIQSKLEMITIIKLVYLSLTIKSRGGRACVRVRARLYARVSIYKLNYDVFIRARGAAT